MQNCAEIDAQLASVCDKDRDDDRFLFASRRSFFGDLRNGREGNGQVRQEGIQKVEKAMHERKQGTLKSGKSGRKVTSKKQAIAIGLSQARKEGAKVRARNLR